MKRSKATVFITAIVLLAVCAAPFAGVGEENARLILITAYRQVGWGDAVQIGYIDEAGGAWLIEGYVGELKWPRAASDQIAWIENAKGFTALETLGSEEMFRLNSLVQCVEDQGGESTPAANDAGTEVSYAVTYSRDEVQTVLLGMSGDDMFENRDPSAQALYLYLRESFPRVTSYFGDSHMAPAGFKPVSLMEFCGYDGVDLTGLRLELTDIDCEAGALPAAVPDGEADGIREKILGLRVTGKHSCIVTTGGSTVYSFVDNDGNSVASFELYRGLLVREDGMYTLE